MIVPFGLEQNIKNLANTPINQTASDPEIDCVEKTVCIIGWPLAAACPLGYRADREASPCSEVGGAGAARR
jgi:hypothetical protein